MRIRFKKWARPELEASKFYIDEPEKYKGTQRVFIKKCEILGNVANIVRAEKNQIGKGDHDLHIIEIISDINFREKYNLKDDECIEIKI